MTQAGGQCRTKKTCVFENQSVSHSLQEIWTHFLPGKTLT